MYMYIYIYIYTHTCIASVQASCFNMVSASSSPDVAVSRGTARWALPYRDPTIRAPRPPAPWRRARFKRSRGRDSNNYRC